MSELLFLFLVEIENVFSKVMFLIIYFFVGKSSSSSSSLSASSSLISQLMGWQFESYVPILGEVEVEVEVEYLVSVLI